MVCPDRCAVENYAPSGAVHIGPLRDPVIAFCHRRIEQRLANMALNYSLIK